MKPDITGQALRSLREKFGAKQKEMAPGVGISIQGVTRLELAKDIRLSTLIGYSKALKGRLRVTLTVGSEVATICDYDGLADSVDEKETSR